VVESNIHYPTDSSLLGDGIRVLSRGLARIAAQCQSGALAVVNHARAVKHRLLEISRAAKSLTPANQRTHGLVFANLGLPRKHSPVFGRKTTYIVRPALQHLLPLLGVLGAVVDPTHAAHIVIQRLLGNVGLKAHLIQSIRSGVGRGL
jgi:hypothetical protein